MLEVELLVTTIEWNLNGQTTLTGKKSESPKVCNENGSFSKCLATVNISFEKITQNTTKVFVHDRNLKSGHDKFFPWFFPTMRFAVVTFREH